MENTYRFRFLIYLAAFMLIMSLCFVYAEPMPSRNPLLFQTAPQRAGFLPPLQAKAGFDPADLRAATTMAPYRTSQAIDSTRARHSFFHRSRKTAPSFVLVNVPDETSVVVLTRQPSPSTAR